MTLEYAVFSNVNRVTPVDQVEQTSGLGSPAIATVTPTQAHEVFLAPFAAATHTAATFSLPQHLLSSSSPDHSALRGVLTYADNNTTGAFYSSYTLGVSINWLSFLISLENDPTPPAPTALTVGSVTSTTVALTWTNPAGGYAVGLANDSVQYGHSTTGPFVSLSVGSVATSDTVTGLACGEPYFFQVEAWNSTGASLPSAQATATTAAPPGCVVNLYGNQSAANYANKTVSIGGGNFTCSSGTLLFDNDTVLIAQNNTGSSVKSAVNNGIVLRSTCALTVKYSTIETNSTPAASYPTFIDQTGGATGAVLLLHSTLKYLGTSTNVPTSHTGVLIQSAHSVVAACAFDAVHTLYYSGVYTGALLAGSTLTGPAGVSDQANSSVYAASTADWFNVTRDTFDESGDDMGILQSGANWTTLSNDTVNGNESSTLLYSITIGAKGADQVHTASHSTLTYDLINNAGVEFIAQHDAPSTGGMQWENVTHTNITSTPNAETRSSYELYFDGTSNAAGTAGLEISHVLVQHDALSNFTGQDALRLGTNVTDFNISYNHIFDFRSGVDVHVNPGTTFGIYIIRDVSHGTVYGNVVDAHDPYDGAPGVGYVSGQGIILESAIMYVNVSHNIVTNFTARAFNIQGSTGGYTAPVWERGASLHNVFYDNTAINYYAVNDNSTDFQQCFGDWAWANGTKFIGNYCRYDGWSTTPSVYDGFAFLVSAQGTYIANNTAVDTNGFVVFTRNAANLEAPAYGLFQTRYNTLFDNYWTGMTLTDGAAVVGDSSAGWANQFNNVSGNTGNASWSFKFIGGSGGEPAIHLVNTVLEWLNGTSVLYTPNVFWYGPSTVTSTGTDYHFNLTRWNTTAAQVSFGALSLTTPVLSHSTADWLNLTPTNDSPGKGDYNVSAVLKVAGKLWVNDTGAIDHDTYLLLVNRAEAASQVAGAQGVAFLVNPASSAEYGVVQTGAPTVPLPPTALGVTSFTNASVSLSWIPPPGTVTDYVVEYGTSPSALTSTYNAGTATSATVTGLLNSTEYWFAVIAYNATGPGSPSNVVEQTTAGTPPPPLVGNLNGLVFLGIGVTIVAGFIVYVTVRRKRNRAVGWVMDDA